jgi:2-iminobutanoate/2-iminopropanoate deaminase
MKKECIVSEKAPKAIGPYSHATRFGMFVFTSGQIGLDPKTNALVAGGIESETRQVLLNLGDVLEASGTHLNQVLKTTVFLRDMNDFAVMNKVYGEFFLEGYPSRSTVQVAALPKNAAVEIEVIAGYPLK